MCYCEHLAHNIVINDKLEAFKHYKFYPQSTLHCSALQCNVTPKVQCYLQLQLLQACTAVLKPESCKIFPVVEVLGVQLQATRRNKDMRCVLLCLGSWWSNDFPSLKRL